MEALKNANITSDQYYILLTNVTDTSFGRDLPIKSPYIYIYIYNIYTEYI